MSDHNGFDFVKGALIGGAIGSVLALLAAPKSGKELRDDIVDGYHIINDKAHDTASSFRDKRKQLARLLNGEEEEVHGYGALVKGGVAGIVFGAIAALLVAPKSGRKMRHDLNSTYNKLRHRAEDFVADIEERGEAALENVESWKDSIAAIVDKATAKGKKHGHGSRVSDIAEWADLGLRIYHQLQNNRR